MEDVFDGQNLFDEKSRDSAFSGRDFGYGNAGAGAGGENSG